MADIINGTHQAVDLLVDTGMHYGGAIQKTAEVGEAFLGVDSAILLGLFALLFAFYMKTKISSWMIVIVMGLAVLAFALYRAQGG